MEKVGSGKARTIPAAVEEAIESRRSESTQLTVEELGSGGATPLPPPVTPVSSGISIVHPSQFGDDLRSLEFAQLLLEQMGDSVGAAQQAWSTGFTNPADHGDEFRYIVHALPSYELSDATKTVWSEGERYELDLVRHPERAGEIELLSGSVVDQEHQTTFFTQWGVLLAVPKENIVAAGQEDLKTGPVRRTLGENYERAAEELAGYCRESGLPAPGELLAGTVAGDYNEVLMLGRTPEGGPIRVVGFFTTNRGPVNMMKFCSEEYAAVAKQARALGLPMIELEAS